MLYSNIILPSNDSMHVREFGLKAGPQSEVKNCLHDCRTSLHLASQTNKNGHFFNISEKVGLLVIS